MAWKAKSGSTRSKYTNWPVGLWINTKSMAGSLLSVTKSSKPKPSAPKPSTSQAKTSLLRIGTLPGVAPAKVFVDGAAKGNTPLSKVMVTPGRHKVVFQWPNGKRVTKFVDVGDGESKIVRGG